MVVASVLEILRLLDPCLNPPLDAVIRVLRRRVLVESNNAGYTGNGVDPSTRVEPYMSVNFEISGRPIPMHAPSGG